MVFINWKAGEMDHSNTAIDKSTEPIQPSSQDCFFSLVTLLYNIAGGENRLTES